MSVLQNKTINFINTTNSSIIQPNTEFTTEISTLRKSIAAVIIIIIMVIIIIIIIIIIIKIVIII